MAALVITNRDVMSHVSYHVSRRCDNYDDGMVFGMGYKYAAHHYIKGLKKCRIFLNTN